MRLPLKSVSGDFLHASSQSLLKYFHNPTHLNNLISHAIRAKSIKLATQIHSQIITNNFTSVSFLFNNLINCYAKCDYLNQSLVLFSNTHQNLKNVISYTLLIRHLSHFDNSIDALKIFNQSREDGLNPDEFTFSAVLPVCADLKGVVNGQQIHSLICKHGFESFVYVGTALVDMYAKCCEMGLAEKVFDAMSERSLASWNAMIVGFLQSKLYDRAIGVFKDVLGGAGNDSVCPDEVSFSSILSASADISCVEFGKQVHAVVAKMKQFSSVYVCNSLLDMYFKCGCFEDVAKLFSDTGYRHAVVWNVMITGWLQNDNFEQACDYIWMMRREGVAPDEVSLSTALNAAACLAALNQGTLVHNQIVKIGFVTYRCVANSLMTMYAKCGSLIDAQKVFEEIECPNVISWTALMTAYQHHGYGDQVILLFDKMLQEGIKPSYITFVCVLSACGHTGRVEKGFNFFNSMKMIYHINPGPEHYSSMVNLLARAGLLNEAKRFVESMPTKPSPAAWGSLLGACRMYGNLEMAKEAAESLAELEPDNPGHYMLLHNMYARSGRSEEADEIWRLMGINQVRKEPSCSWIEVKNTTFVFKVHDRSHGRTEEIYKMLKKLKELMKRKGYVAQPQLVLKSGERQKGQSLWYHSERLALAFGLLTLPNKAPIRIKKNLRTCSDCHTVMKLASEIFQREIILRDTNGFLRFVDGICSCRDIW